MSCEEFVNIDGPHKRKIIPKHVGVTSSSEISLENEFARTSEMYTIGNWYGGSQWQHNYLFLNRNLYSKTKESFSMEGYLFQFKILAKT